MKYKGRGIQFQKLIGESHPKDERKGIGYTIEELRQIDSSQKLRCGVENTWDVDHLGIMRGYKSKAVVWSC